MSEASQLTRPCRRKRKRRKPCQSFASRKEWFNPDFALVYGLLVGIGLVVPLNALVIVRKKRTMHVPTPLAGSTVRFKGAGIAGARSRTVFHELCLLFSVKAQPAVALEGSDTDHGQRHR